MDNIWIFIGIVIFVFIGYSIFHLLINKAINDNNKRFPIDAMNGIKLILRFIGAIIILVSFFIFIPVPPEIVISITTVSGVIIGFGSSQVMDQVIAGIYLISARPFGVNDLVQFGDSITGIVLEIGINYTKLLQMDRTIIKIPNKKVLDSSIKNFTLKLSDELEKRQTGVHSGKDTPKITQQNVAKGKISWDRLWGALGELTEFIFEPDITRFVFDIAIEHVLDPKFVIEKLDDVCRLYTHVYSYRPRYHFWNIFWRTTIRFQVYCPDPMLIVHNHNNFVTDILTGLYGGDPEEEEVEAP